MPQKYNFLIAFDVFLLVAHFLLNVVHWVPTKHYQHVLHVNFMYCRRRNNWAIPISTCCIKGVSNNITSSILMTYWLLLTETCVKVPQKVCGCFYVALCACMQALPRSIQERIVRKHRNNEKSFFFSFYLAVPSIYCLLFWLLLVYRIFIPHFVYRQHAGLMYRKKMAASQCIFLFLSPHQPSSSLWCLGVHYVYS